MMRPWTAIWKDTETGQRRSSIFQGHFDTGQAVNDFQGRYDNRVLEALIPGVHDHLYNSNQSNTIERNPPAEHDHGV